MIADNIVGKTIVTVLCTLRLLQPDHAAGDDDLDNSGG